MEKEKFREILAAHKVSRRQSCTEKEFRNAAKVGSKDLQCVWKSKDKEHCAEKCPKMEDRFKHGRTRMIFQFWFQFALSPGVGLYFGELISTFFQTKFTKGFFRDLGPSFGLQVFGGGIDGQQFPAWRHGSWAMIGSRSTTDLLWKLLDPTVRIRNP